MCGARARARVCVFSVNCVKECLCTCELKQALTIWKGLSLGSRASRSFNFCLAVVAANPTASMTSMRAIFPEWVRRIIGTSEPLAGGQISTPPNQMLEAGYLKQCWLCILPSAPARKPSSGTCGAGCTSVVAAVNRAAVNRESRLREAGSC